MEQQLMKVELRFALATTGGPFVMTNGMEMMQLLSVDNSDSLTVRVSFSPTPRVHVDQANVTLTLLRLSPQSNQEMQSPFPKLSLAVELGLSG